MSVPRHRDDRVMVGGYLWRVFTWKPTERER